MNVNLRRAGSGRKRAAQADNRGRIPLTAANGARLSQPQPLVRPRTEFEYDSYARLKLVRDPKKRETQFTSDHLKTWGHIATINN
jgi:hypothetical protein